jgi:SAM-dependent methyltransferase
MSMPEDYSFIQYLIAKKRVDDRALNLRVLETLANNLPPDTQASPLRILEIGSGIGTMLVRLLEWGLINHAFYTAIDLDNRNIIYCKQYLSEWAVQQNLNFEDQGNHGFCLNQSGNILNLELETIDLMEFMARESSGRKWDLIMAHAFLDLVDIPLVIPPLLSLLSSEGLFYFTLNFDGTTILDPPISQEFDRLVIDLYHLSMDLRRFKGPHSGSSRSGTRLLNHLISTGNTILSAGSSDWVVYPQDSRYHDDEAYFLHYIIHTIFEELKSHPKLDPHKFQSWVNQRHMQIERGELVFIAHQLDILGRVNDKDDQLERLNP